jgi:AraC family transcriptional regulator of adaptative response / DNA-3-methyladenine glycosylase II
LAQPEHEYIFRLHFRPPFHWEGLLDFLSQRAVPGVEAVESGIYRRTISLNGESGTLAVSLSANRDALEVCISFPEPRWLFLIVERVRQMFDLSADPSEIGSRLSRDSLLIKRLAAMPGLRVPGCWDGFELSVRALLGQQVSVRAARTLAGRLVNRFGTQISTEGTLTHLFPSPEQLAHANISSIGLTQARGESIRLLARAVVAGEINFASVVNLEEFQSRLCELPGIGNWTAQYIAMRALGDPDAFPAGDLGLLRATSSRNERDLARRAERWRPWRAYAALYLWQTSGDLEENPRPPATHRPLSKHPTAIA